MTIEVTAKHIAQGHKGDCKKEAEDAVERLNAKRQPMHIAVGAEVI